MCCLFGLLDPKGSLTRRELNHLVRMLSVAAEQRGTDAAGIAYNAKDRLAIYKRPLAAHQLQLKIPGKTRAVMGHTRMTTQGSEKHNFNNHPFFGKAGRNSFALAHNGVLSNDRELRHSLRLPKSKTKTDSYVAVQMLEQLGDLSFASLRQVAEKLTGTYTFTLLDDTDALYIIKGNNPLCLYHWPASGIYIYASTEEILDQALQYVKIDLGPPEEIFLSCGDLVRIDRHSAVTRSTFDVGHLQPDTRWYYPSYPLYNWKTCSPHDLSADTGHIDTLKSVAGAFGYNAEDVDTLLAQGLTLDEIEDYLYEGVYCR